MAIGFESKAVSLQFLNPRIKMMLTDQLKPVLVTGATGYVAGWLVKHLLELGITVHAAVRNPEDKIKLAHLDAMAAKASGKIRYFNQIYSYQGHMPRRWMDARWSFIRHHHLLQM